MTICFKNKSGFDVDVFIQESRIKLSIDETCFHEVSFNTIPIEIKFSIVDNKNPGFDNKSCCINISTVIFCELISLSDAVLNIESELKKFQNNTEYRYLKIKFSNKQNYQVKHIVDNYELLLDYSKSTQKKSKNKIIHAVKKSIIDTLLDVVLFSALLAWIFSFQIAVIALLSIFIISLTINMIKIRTSKSRFRFLNFDRDLEIPDDIEYFINNIEKYCI